MPIVYTNTIGHIKNLNLSNIGRIKDIITQTPNVYLDCQVSLINNEYVVNWDYMEGTFEQEEIKSYFDIFQKTLLKIIFDEGVWTNFENVAQEYAKQNFEEGTI